MQPSVRLANTEPQLSEKKGEVDSFRFVLEQEAAAGEDISTIVDWLDAKWPVAVLCAPLLARNKARRISSQSQPLLRQVSKLDGIGQVQRLKHPLRY